jgi:hypothetical protein
VNGYITPPPGLLPGVPQVDAPRREQIEAAPSPITGFTTAPLGRPPQVPAAPPAPAPAGAPAEASAPPAELIEETSFRAVAQPGQAAAAWTLRLPDGSGFTLPGATFVGRNPVATDAAPGGAVLPLDDPAKSLSKTHALLVPSDGYVMVTDLHSTNGAAVVGADGAVTVLEPGRSVAVETGSVLQLGNLAVTLLRG